MTDTATNVTALTTRRLGSIVNAIAKQAQNMVKGAWTIGSKLNEAQELLADDTEFGRWRREHIEPMGISKRTAQRMQAVARRFATADELPSELTLGHVYLLAGDATPPAAQARILELVEEGNIPTVQEARLIAAQASHRARNPGNCDPEEVADDQERRDGLVMDEDGNIIDDAPPAAPQAPRAANPVPQEDEDVAWAEVTVQALRRKSGAARGRRLGALVAELRKAGLLQVEDSITVSANLRTGAIDVTV